jgi:hypothetical protein
MEIRKCFLAVNVAPMIVVRFNLSAFVLQKSGKIENNLFVLKNKVDLIEKELLAVPLVLPTWLSAIIVKVLVTMLMIAPAWVPHVIKPNTWARIVQRENPSPRMTILLK